MQHPIAADLLAQRWTPAQAQAWHQRLPWLMGANFCPSTAGNQLEMWSVETFDPATIDRELGWAAAAGMNAMRVFLHDLFWIDDASGFLERIETYLQIADQHGISTLFVFFDSVWHPFPHLGTQREPERGVHNSMWVQSPGVPTLRNPQAFRQLETYVRGVIRHFREDPRIHGWDLWNEPDNANTSSYGPRDLGAEKSEKVEPLLAEVFRWARAEKPTQPLTSGVWMGDWSDDLGLTPLQRLQLYASDIISFHNYQNLSGMQKVVASLARFQRPLWCTEYMARGANSLFTEVTPWLQAQKIGAYNWGLVQGRTQTHLPWPSWQTPATDENGLWFHEVFHSDGRPYDAGEIAVLKAARAAAPSSQPVTHALTRL